jgi:hypothetical protein
VSEELGIVPEDFEELPEDEEDETYFQLLETTTQRLFTNELRQELITAVDTLRLRLKQTGRYEEVPQVAGLQLILNDRNSKEMWPSIGLIQAIVRRSLETGFELVEASSALAGEDGESEAGFEEAQQKFEAILERVPGLTGFLEEEADKIWAAGSDDVFTGRLFLDLFTPEERNDTLEIITETVEDEAGAARPDKKGSRAKLGTQEAQKIISNISDYLQEILTPERFDQLQEQLDLLLEEEDYPPQHRAFLLMLAEDMAHEENREMLWPFLIRALFFEAIMAETDSDEMDETDE